jgi:hypothetical protein
VVDDTKASLQSHVNGHLVLGNSVHRRGHERGLQSNALGDGRIKHNFRCGETNVAWENEEVIVSKTSVFFGVDQIRNAKTILEFVFLENFKSFGVVQDFLGRSQESRGRWLRVAVCVRHFVSGEEKDIEMGECARDSYEWCGGEVGEKK